jgi:polysaccharide biosynthesis PFTS motif protein
MNIPFISKFIYRNGRSKFRLINKGYRKLKSENKLYIPNQLIYALSSTKLYNTGSLKGLFCKSDFDVELSIRQFITSNFLGDSFKKSILYTLGSNGSLRHPLPKEWRIALTKKGVNVNNIVCALLWHLYSIIFWCRGVFNGLKSVYFLIQKQPSIGKYIYFDNLYDNNISTNSNKHNILNWYLRWKNRNIEIISICHNARDTSNFQLGEVGVVRTDGLPRLSGLALIQYIFNFIYTTFYSFLCVLFKPTYGFFLDDSIKLKRFDLADKSDLARDYLFHNSSPYYRPMWTYVAQNKGSRILFYFYSTHTDFFYRTCIENFKIKSNCSSGLPFHLMSWSYYLVWDKFHKNFIKRNVQNNPKIENVGHIWFSSGGDGESVVSNSIAVFDVTPKRFSMHIHLGSSFEYYIPSIVIQFLSDIQQVLSQNNVKMLHKIKRKNQSTDKRYKTKLNRLSYELNYIKADPDIDACQIIQKTRACISIPFTSTALIAKQEGRPSVYYDPTGKIQKDDQAAHGIPVISGIDELRLWVKSHSTKAYTD